MKNNQRINGKGVFYVLYYHTFILWDVEKGGLTQVINGLGCPHFRVIVAHEGLYLYNWKISLKNPGGKFLLGSGDNPINLG